MTQIRFSRRNKRESKDLCSGAQKAFTEKDLLLVCFLQHIFMGDGKAAYMYSWILHLAEWEDQGIVVKSVPVFTEDCERFLLKEFSKLEGRP